MKTEIEFLKFNELSLEQLYEILKLRVDVFVVEQQCHYAEIDNQDQQSIHVLLGRPLQAYARILFEKGKLHIGRIVVQKESRNNGIGRHIMKQCMQYCKANYPSKSIYISAQSHLEDYYKSFGFKTVSEPYDWDGILHKDMLFSLPNQ